MEFDEELVRAEILIGWITLGGVVVIAMIIGFLVGIRTNLPAGAAAAVAICMLSYKTKSWLGILRAIILCSVMILLTILLVSYNIPLANFWSTLALIVFYRFLPRL